MRLMKVSGLKDKGWELVIKDDWRDVSNGCHDKSHMIQFRTKTIFITQRIVKYRERTIIINILSRALLFEQTGKKTNSYKAWKPFAETLKTVVLSKNIMEKP